MTKDIPSLCDRLRADIRTRIFRRRSAPTASVIQSQPISGFKVGYQNGQPVMTGDKTVHSLIISATGGGKSNAANWSIAQRLLSPEPRGMMIADGNGTDPESLFHHSLLLYHQLA